MTTEKLCKAIRERVCFGLKQAMSKKCKAVYVLEDYYPKIKHLLEGVEISFYNWDQIRTASVLENRGHRIQLIGL